MGGYDWTVLVGLLLGMLALSCAAWFGVDDNMGDPGDGDRWNGA